jgi:hypothetical protein
MTETEGMPVFQAERQRKLIFRNEAIETADLKDGNGYVSVRSLCEAFGLDGRAQRRRLLRNQGHFQNSIAMIMIDTAGGPQATLCLVARAVPIFLAGVDLSRIQNEGAREVLKAFQDEAEMVLAEHFGISERSEMLFLRTSIGRMVAEQESLEETLLKKVEDDLADLRRAHEEKVQEIRNAFANLRQQMVRLETYAGPKARLTPEQLGQIRILTATLGTLLQEKGIAKPYPGIYMDITRLTGVSRSEDIRQEDFSGVVEFLEKQVKALTQAAKAAKNE